VLSNGSRALLLSKLWLYCLLGCGCISTYGWSTTIITYPQTESRTDPRARYPIALLQLCLAKTSLDFQLRPSADPMQQARSLRLVETNGGVDVLWTLTSIAREAKLRAIRIPIDRGLMGWRLLLIKQQDQEKFDHITSVEGLALLEGGQGHDWPDLPILRLGKLSVTGSSSYQGLFKMLARGHIDYFPRSAMEIWPELDAHQGQHGNIDFAVEETMAIHYPAALYFFVHKNNQQLADALENGLRLAIADGSMQQLFNQFFHATLNLSRLHERRVITLENPLLPKETPLANASYWFNPAEAVQ
jgi:hypothetical protein